ncbi:ATP-binding protein [Bacillus salitolerans]|uniref:histidine kinase n=1 Tax=Bacillus salitolerans TaxID=1437434 RepID=A0ABW4LP92_9BACI
MASFLTYVIELEDSEKRTTFNFKQLHHQSELILSSLTEGVFGLDLDGNISFVNPASSRLIRVDADQLIGRTPFETFIKQRREESELIHTLTDGKTRTNNDGYFHNSNGTRFPVEYTVKAMYEDGNISGAIVTFKDITERKESEKYMLQSEKLSLAGQLAAGIAHEIRNPLTSIKGFLQMIKAGYQKDSYIDIMTKELDRIELIASELLLLAKPQINQYKPVEIGHLLKEVVSILDTESIMNDVEVTFFSEYEDLIINGDPNQIKQVFLNFIKNAIDASSKGQNVQIKLLKEEEHALILVKDYGVGIPEEKLGQLGQPFYSTKEKGTGLGLMVSYNIIENHRGQISVKSKLNEGTTFEVRFPIVVNLDT